LKTSPEELSDLVSLTNTDLETTINAARHAVSLQYDPKGKFPLFPFCQPKFKSDPTGGLAR
jgi:hypothetical protein